MYSTFLRQQGFDNLYTLEGGIQNYLEEESSEQWKGSLYVFDDRMAVAPSHLRLSREGEAGGGGDGSHDGCSSGGIITKSGEGPGSEPRNTGADATVARRNVREGPGIGVVGGAREACKQSGEVSEGSSDGFEKPRAAVPCVLCGGEPELPHINCANVDCNVLLLVCDECKAELQGCCCEECRDNAPRLVRPIKDGEHPLCILF